MRSWEDLTLLQKLIIGAGILLFGMFAPEIALLVHFGGIEVAFAFLVFYSKPVITWLSAKLKACEQALAVAWFSYTSSASAQPRVYATQTVFCCLAVALTGSMAFSVSFLMPAMMFNSMLI